MSSNLYNVAETQNLTLLLQLLHKVRI